MSLDREILRLALENAIDYKGKANFKAVIGKVMGQKRSLGFEDIKIKVKNIVDEVNSMKLEEQKEMFKAFKPTEKVEKSKERKIPDLDNVKDKVVMRFAPNPNGAMSFGHSRIALWNWFFVEKYNGKYVLRFDDTDAKIKVPLKEAYDWFEEDLKWLGIKVDKTVVQSSRLKKYYEYVEKLIKKDKVYVCRCDVEKKRKKLMKGESCDCREESKEEVEKQWKKMFDDYKEGEAVLRIKTNLEDKNPAVRDWAAFRIVNESKHPLEKAKVWPLLNFASAIDDKEFGITHILRGIDLKISDDRQKFIYDIFGWEYPETIYAGKLLVEGVKSTSEVKKLIDEGKIKGWDDPRLGTLKALRRRGFRKEAIIKFVRDAGLRKSDIRVSLDNLEACNKEIIDKVADRYMFVEGNSKIKIKSEVNEVEFDNHPDDKKRGKRKIKIGNEFYVKDEIKKTKVYRLMHLFNFKNGNLVSVGYDAKLNANLIHWVAVNDAIKVEVVMKDKIIKGHGESALGNLNVDDVVQFVRFGFVRLDRKDVDKLVFYYTHD